MGVKIGRTAKSVEERIKSLNSTGVAGEFEAVAIFPSDKPAFDEKRVHDKLKKYNISKEHFDLTPMEAMLGAFRALNKRRPIFYDRTLEEPFWLRLEQAKIEMKLKLTGNA